MTFKDSIKSFLGLADAKQTSTDFSKVKRVITHVEKPIARTRQDIKKWNTAQNLTNTDEPKNYLIQQQYNDAALDALLTSQIENRLQQVLNNPVSVVNEAGEVDEEQTKKLRTSKALHQLLQASWEKNCYGYNLVELQYLNDSLNVVILPRENVVPKLGRFYPDYTEDKFIEYRTMKEYGTYLLEFNSENIGLLNKAIPHVLFKRFAQSCWSELCELYGIPPRVLKTNTQDKGMLNRAEAMMRDMSAAAWFIIDSEESFEWAKGTDTNGDVYSNLITLCNNEISLLLSGAVIGQDTKNGSNAKETENRKALQELVKSDLTSIAQDWNDTIVPALIKLGFLKGNVSFKFDNVDDIDKLWQFTKEALPFYNIDPEWVKTKFGIEVTGEKTTATIEPNSTEPNKKKLADTADFFG
jgi:hypothetical protein